MSILKSVSDHLTLNAEGTSKSIKFQSAGVEKASISPAGAFTSTTIDATVLTGALPAISGASLTSLSAASLSGSPTFTTVTATTFSGSGASLTSLPASSLSGSPTFTTLNATTVDLGNWTVTESGGVLYFATSGTNKMKLDASGNLTVVGDLTAYGTI